MPQRGKPFLVQEQRWSNRKVEISEKFVRKESGSDVSPRDMIAPHAGNSVATEFGV